MLFLPQSPLHDLDILKNMRSPFWNDHWDKITLFKDLIPELI